MKSIRKLSAGFVCVALAASIACNTSKVLNTLSNVVDAVALAAPIVVGITGNPKGIDVAQIVSYLEAATSATSQAVNEWRSGDSNAVKFEKIAGYFSGVLAMQNQLGPINDPNLSARIDAVKANVAAFTGQVQAGRARARTASKANLFPMGGAERTRLDAIKKKAEQAKSQLEQAKR